MDLQKLLDDINAKKLEVQNLVKENKIDEAKDAKAELQMMQDKYDLLSDMQDNGKTPMSNNVKPVVEPKDPIHEFANAARHHFKNSMNEGTAADGGYTVPADIQTKINEYKEAKFSLKKLVRVEPVGTNSGRRIFKVKTAHTGFSAVNEGAPIGQKATPTFSKIDYTIEKYAGILPVTDELLADSDANISNVLIGWLGDEEVATENAQILSLIDPGSTGTNFTSNVIDGIKTALNVTLGQAYAENAAIITNDDGFNYLDTLKITGTNEYLLKPAKDQTAPTPYTLAVGARRVPVVVVPNAVFPSTVVATGDNAGTYMPFVVGDLKEAVAFFDRQQLSVMTSNTASINVTSGDDTTVLSAFESDVTLFRGIMRFDVVSRDSGAIVKGYVKKA